MTASSNATHGYGRADRNERRAWGRIFGSTGKVRDGSGSAPSRFDSFREHGPRYDVDLGGMQLGLDVYRHLDDDGSRDMAGAYFAASHAKADVEAVLGGHAGKVSMNGYSLGAYWTHMGRSRWYLDAVAQLTKYDGVSVRPVDAEKISPDGWGMAASIEAGKPFRLNQNWTFEPQAQLIYQHISWSGSERDRFGKFRFSDSDAVYSRLGARVVRNWEQSDGREYAIWARANVWHNFSAKANTTFTSLNGQNAVTLGTNLGGTWGQFGLGFNAQLKDNLNAFIAVDYERSLGSRRSHGASGRVGVQYVW